MPDANHIDRGIYRLNYRASDRGNKKEKENFVYPPVKKVNLHIQISFLRFLMQFVWVRFYHLIFTRFTSRAPAVPTAIPATVPEIKRKGR